MNLADDLSRLEQQHKRGALTDAEFEQAKTRLLAGDTTSSPVVAVNAFRRSASDRWLGGVCGGLARSTGLATWIWRILFVVMLCMGGTGALLYLLLWIFAPTE